MLHDPASLLKRVRRLLRQGMHAAVHIRMHVRVILAPRLNHSHRLLSRRSAIEVNERLVAVNGPRKNGKLRANAGDV